MNKTKKMQRALLLIAAHAAATGADGQDVTAPVGRMPATFNVTDGGAASYSVPLILPPGRNGMQPSLSLTYSSQQGDGPIGVGWSIGGLSEISRCARVPARNGVRRPITFGDPSPMPRTWDPRAVHDLDAIAPVTGGTLRLPASNADEYCLDGEPLLLLSGRRGEDGSEYRTERESFRRIIGVGTPHLTFRVFERDGGVREYGRANKCEDLVQGNAMTGSCTALAYARGGVVRAWLLARVTDAFGNYMTYDYTRLSDTHREDFNGDGREDDTRLAETAEVLPSRIRYAGHEGDGLLPQRSVVFDYERRPDTFSGYFAGLHVQRQWRLKRVVTALEGRGTVLESRISYAVSRSTRRSRVESIRLCTGSGVCGQPTTFTWSGGVRTFALRQNTGIPAPPLNVVANRRTSMRDLLAADFTGDGKADLAFPRGGTWRLVTAHGRASPTGWIEKDTGIEATAAVSAQTMDYNQDGRQDLLLITGSRPNSEGRPETFKVLLGSESGFSEIDTGVRYFPLAIADLLNRVHLVDVDGDGIQDLVTCALIDGNRPAPDTPQPWTYRIHTGAGFGDPHEIPMFPESSARLGCRGDRPFLVDADGDGSTNFLLPDGATYKAAVLWDARNPTWRFLDTQLPSFVGYFDGARAIDVNGDGLDDAVWQFQGQQTVAQVWMNTGRGFIGAGTERRHAGADILQAIADDRGEFEQAIMQSLPFDADLDGRGDLLIPATTCRSTGEGRRITSDCNEPGRIGTHWSLLTGTGARTAFDEPGFAFTRRTLSMVYNNIEPAGTVHPSETLYQRPRIVDVDGNMLPDLVLVEGECRAPSGAAGASGARSGCFVVYLSTGTPPDLLTGVREGFASDSTEGPSETYEVEYGTTRMGPSEIYSAEYVGGDAFFAMPRPPCTAELPCRRPAMTLVARVRADRGPGLEAQETRYTWHDARFDRQGLGFTGFGQRTIHESSPGRFTVVRTDNTTQEPLGEGRYAYPYRGAALSVRTRVSLGQGHFWRERRDTVYDVRPGSARHTFYPFVTRTSARAEDVAGTTVTLLREDTTDSQIDDFGNATLQVQTHADGQEERIESEFSNDTTRWRLGLLTSETIRSRAGGRTRRRTSAFTYHDDTGAPRTTTRAPDDTTKMRVTELHYDRFGNVEGTTDRAPSMAVSRSTASNHGDAEHMFTTRTENALGHVVQRVFDPAFGQVLRSTDANGVTSTWKYDGFGRLVEQRTGGGGTTTTQYAWVDGGARGSHLRVTTSGTAVARRVVDFDRLARPVRERVERLGGRMAAFTRTYGRDGKLREITLPRFAGEPPLAPERFVTDALGRLVSHRRADGHEVSISHRGRTTEIRDARGSTVVKEVNGIGQIVSMRDASDGVTRYEYGPFGQLSRVIDAAGNVTSIESDDYGRTVAIHDPDSGTRASEYDAFDRRTREVDARGQVTESRFDTLDRLAVRRDAEGESMFAYDSAPHGVGQLAGIRGPWGHFEHYRFDDLGRLAARVQTIDGEEHSEELAYDDAGRIATRTLTSAGWTGPRTLAYRYGPDRIVSLLAERNAQGVEVPIWRARSVDASGRLQLEQFGSGLSGIQTYDAASGRLESVIVRPEGGVPIQHLSFGHDPNGNLTRRRDVLATLEERYAYDALDRLITGERCRSAACAPSLAVRYDAIGNIVNKSDVGDYSYDPRRPHAVVRAGNALFDYDAAGNQVERTGVRLEYTSFNKPLRISGPGDAKESYEYDASHRLLVHRSKDETVVYANAVTRRKRGSVVEDEIAVRVGGRTIAVLTEVFREGAHLSQIVYVHDDHLGSPYTLTDAAGRVVDRRRFDAFGRSLGADWASPPGAPASERPDIGFTGHPMPDDLGLIDMGGRIYDPALGRFLSVDPLVSQPFQPQALNRYSYVLNNPLTLRDSSGLAPDGAPPTKAADPDIRVTAERTCAHLFCYISEGFNPGADRDEGVSKPTPLQRLVLTFVVPGGAALSTFELVGSLSRGDLAMVPVVGALQAFDRDTEAAFDAVIDERPLAAGGYAVLALGDGVFAVVDALTLGEAGTAAQQAIDKVPQALAKACNSFAADTPVWTEAGLAAIQDVGAGIQVTGLDMASLSATDAMVTAAHRHDDSLVVELTLGGEHIVTTPGHMFLTRERGWVPAGELTVKEVLVRIDGSFGRVDAVRPAVRTLPMFNLSVDRTETFAVGRGGWVVHNTNTCLVYIARNADGALVYVGITNNFARRALQHLKNKLNPKEIQQIPGFEIDNLTRAEAHNVEQALLKDSGGFVQRGQPVNSALMNKINSISPAVADYAQRVAEGRKILQQRGWLP